MANSGRASWSYRVLELNDGTRLTKKRDQFPWFSLRELSGATIKLSPIERCVRYSIICDYSQSDDSIMTKRTREVFPSGIGTSNLRTISSRLHYVQRLLDRQTKKYLSKSHELTNAEWAILGYLAWHSPQSVAAISDETALFRSQVSRAITELERKQLVRRSSNPRDRRSPAFSISAIGLKVQHSIAKWAFRRERSFKKLLSDQQIETLNESLGILAQYLKAEK